MTATMLVSITFKAETEQQTRAMMAHTEKAIAKLLGDEQEKSNIEVTNLETIKTDPL